MTEREEARLVFCSIQELFELQEDGWLIYFMFM
jgi:hypothetical protein